MDCRQWDATGHRQRPVGHRMFGPRNNEAVCKDRSCGAAERPTPAPQTQSCGLSLGTQLSKLVIV